jgi:tetratricopeptide (TPR) repeat protein
VTTKIHLDYRALLWNEEESNSGVCQYSALLHIPCGSSEARCVRNLFIQFVIRVSVDATLEFSLAMDGKKCTIESTFDRRKRFFQLDSSIESSIRDIEEAIRDQRPLDEKFVEDLGTTLFNILFQDNEDLFTQFLDHYDNIRIILNMKDPFLNVIPWELCYDPETEIFLGADSHCSLVRRDQQSQQSLGKIDYPLKILVIISSPLDLEEKGEFRLNPDKIIALMNPVKNLQDKGLVRIDFLERASVQRIQDKMKEGYHIVHFIGHGFYDVESQRGYLIIEDKQRNAKNVEGRGLAQLFGIAPPQLAILTACESSALIPLLLSKKVPAVLGMQFTVLKGTAFDFVERFYSLLVRGDSVFEAVSHARIAIQLEEGTTCTGWFTPVLYARADELLQVNPHSPVKCREKVQRYDMVTDLIGVEDFVGRRTDLWLLEKALFEDTYKAAVITGIRGIGKTALVAKFSEKFKNAVRGVFAKRIVDLHTTMEEVLWALDEFLMEHGDRRLHEVIGQIDLDLKLARLNMSLKDGYLLVLDGFDVLLDNGRIVDEGMEQFLRAFLTGDHASKIIITSRYRFAFEDKRASSLIRYVDLKELTAYDVNELLENQDITDHTVRRRIYQKVGGNPQCLELFVELTKLRPIEGLLEDPTLVKERIGDQLFHEVLDQLTDGEKEAVKMMSSFRLKVDKSAFDILGVPLEVADELVRHSLMRVENDQYVMYQGVRQYVYELLTDAERIAAHTAAVQYYEKMIQKEYTEEEVSFLFDLDMTGLPHQDGRSAHIFDREDKDLRIFLEFHYHLVESGQYSRAGKLVADSVTLFLRRGYWRKLMKLLVQTIRTTTGRIRVAGLHDLGIVFQYEGETEKARALFERSLKSAQILQDKQAIAASLHQLGIDSHLRGDYAKAETLYERSLQIAEDLQDKQGMARSLHQLGIIYQLRGKYEEAEKLHERSLQIAEDLQDKQGMARSLHQLGIIYQLRGKSEEAEIKFKESLQIAEDLQDKQGISASLYQLGTIYEEREKYEEAEIKFKESLQIAEDLQDKQGMARLLHQLGIISTRNEQYEQAENRLKKSLDMRRGLGDSYGIARSLHQLAILYEEQAKYEEAIQYYIDSLRIYLNLKSPDAEEVVRSLQRIREITGKSEFEKYWEV